MSNNRVDLFVRDRSTWRLSLTAYSEATLPLLIRQRNSFRDQGVTTRTEFHGRFDAAAAYRNSLKEIQ